MAVQFQHVIQSDMGLHARPAGLLAKKAKSLCCTVTVTFGGSSCDARKLIQLMSLEAQQGDTIDITVEGEGEAAAAEEMKVFLKEVL